MPAATGFATHRGGWASRFRKPATSFRRVSSSSRATPTSAPPVATCRTISRIDGEKEILPGIRGIPTPGHVPYHQSVLVESGGEKACFIADLVPTSAHLPLPWIMGYDLQPLVTLETRRGLYQRIEAEQWLLVFEHDPTVISGRLGRDGKGFGLVEQKVLG